MAGGRIAFYCNMWHFQDMYVIHTCSMCTVHTVCFVETTDQLCLHHVHHEKGLHVACTTKSCLMLMDGLSDRQNGCCNL